MGAPPREGRDGHGARPGVAGSSSQSPCSPFAFTTLVSNFYYAEVSFRFLLQQAHRHWMLSIFRGVAALLVFAGAHAKFGSRGTWATS